MSLFKKKKKNVIFVIVLLVILILSFLIIFLRSTNKHYTKEIFTEEVNCIDNFFVLPQYYTVESDFELNHEFISKYNYSNEFCFKPREFLDSNKNYGISLKLFDLNFLSKDFYFNKKEHPKIEKQHQEIGARGRIKFKLEREIPNIQYYVYGKNVKGECKKQNEWISCFTKELNLQQDREYDLSLIKRNRLGEEKHLKEFSIKTHPPLKIKENKTDSENIFKPKISIIFDQEIKEINDLKLEHHKQEIEQLDIDVQDNVLSVKPKYKLKHSSNYEISIKDVKGLNGNFLDEEEIINFKTKTIIGNWWKYPEKTKITEIPEREYLALVSKKYKLPKSYEPKDLVDASKSNIDTKSDILIRNIVIENLKNLGKAAQKDGVHLTILSGYRCYETQKGSFQRAIERNSNNLDLAKRVAAKAGHSEHQLGTVIDFGTKESETFQSFNNTRAASWLEENAWQYGFVKSYPQKAQHITGFIHEGWHYRYIGKENAKKVQNSPLVLEQWLIQKEIF